MENPFASPQSDCHSDRDYDAYVEVVLRRRLVWRRCEQIYRFDCPIDPNVLAAIVVDFFARQNTRPISSEGMTYEFERLGTTTLLAWFRTTEKAIPQTIAVSLERIDNRCRVTCHYRLRIRWPLFGIFVPPDGLELEVRDLARECNV